MNNQSTIPKVLDPGTTCLFLSSGHLGSGFAMEFYCSAVRAENGTQLQFWTVNVRDLN